MSRNVRSYLILFSAIAVYLLIAACHSEAPIDFAAQIKPILNKRCISCHGGVKENGGLNLLTRELALRKNESGIASIIPGDAAASSMIRRLHSEDPEFRMPQDAPSLPPEEVVLLEQWIDQGAKWQKHWSYKPVEQIQVPSEIKMGSLAPASSSPSDLDLFVLDALSDKSLQPNLRADRPTLLRRISLDLIGMPPPQKLVEKYLDFDNPLPTEALLDSLMRLPQFGEKWASMWLDLARYADSKGYERDPHRNMWKYRDWVIRAFNQDMPYDQFIIEQIAGDMLPNPTDDQLLATGFHRNTSTNDEGGSDNEEYRVYAVLDRVNTTYEGLLGTTMSCVQCHSHPYDPIMHDEYYKSMAFLNNTRDADTSPDYPLLRHFEGEDSTKLQRLIGYLDTVMTTEEVSKVSTFLKTWMPARHGIESDSFINSALYDMKYLGLRQDGSARMAQTSLEGKNSCYIRYRTGRDDGRLTITTTHGSRDTILSEILPKTEGWEIHRFDIAPSPGVHDIVLHYYSPSVPLDSDAPHVRFDWLSLSDVDIDWRGFLADTMKNDFWHLLNESVPGTPIMIENPADMRRTSHRFDRGNFMVHAEEVTPDIPAELGNWPEGTKKDRLGFAQWIVSEDNPLTARTWVNRIWSQLFGLGIVETLGDLGSQGAVPSHPELLDWMSWEMMHTHDWHLKSFLKMVMLSDTYQQSSISDPEKTKLDPQNKWLARGPRVRLTAEQIRDQALAVSGLINYEMYGPSVMPYQPIQWQTPYSSDKWVTASDGQQHRRAVYTYWKRSNPYPAMMIFDAAERNTCSTRRIQTNTPLHALVTLNDPVYMEAATHLAELMMASSPDIEDRIEYGYQRTMFDKMPDEELGVLLGFYQDVMDRIKEGSVQPKEILQDHENKNSQELAALTMVANSMLNMDALIVKN